MTEDDTFLKLAKPTFEELLIILENEPEPGPPLKDMLKEHHWTTDDFVKEYANRMDMNYDNRKN